MHKMKKYVHPLYSMYKYPTKSRSNIVLSQLKIGISLSIQLSKFKIYDFT